MANEEQLSILKQGVEVWNEWRDENPNVGIDLIKADLNHLDLSEIDFIGANLTKANLEGTNLSDANLSKANLTEAWLWETNLNFTNLIKANLVGINLTGANLTDAYLNGANLKEANLFEAILIGTDLSEASLVGANFIATVFIKVKFTNTDISTAIMEHTVFVFNDLSKVIGLETVRHNGRTSLSIDTLIASRGKIPIAFLRGCGLSDLEIEFSKLATPGLDPGQATEVTYNMHELYVGGGIQYYSCFISYSSKDHEFAQKLHDDLQDNGVRCWFDQEDIKIGDPIRPTIDRQIRLRDKLLVILSENSVKSEWVGDEVEGAIEEETKSNRLVLFPIRLDDTVLNTRDDWAAKIKRRRHIGDFSNWKDKVSYQKAFERLLRDLKATGGQVNGE